MSRWKMPVLVLAGILLGAGCGGADSGSTGAAVESVPTKTPAEAHNEAVLGQAESDAETETEILEILDHKLGLFEYAGVDDSFAVPTENRCDIDGVRSEDELRVYGGERNLLLSPDGKVGVEVGTFVDSQLAPCLQAVGKALGWTGDAPPPVPITPSRSAFVLAGDATCKVNNDTAEDLFADVETWDDEARAASEFRPTAIEAAERFQELEPPASVAKDAARYAVLLDQKLTIEAEQQELAAEVARGYSIGEAAEKEAEQAFAAAERRHEANYDERHRLAKAIGFKICAG